MRLFAADSLIQIADRQEDFPDLASCLKDVGAFRGGRPAVLGVMLSLDRDYRSILDPGAPIEVANRLFFRLLDGRIMLAVVRLLRQCMAGIPLTWRGSSFVDVDRSTAQMRQRTVSAAIAALASAR
jgi:hypothetical protein